MKLIFPLTFVTLLLCGCPDSKFPTPPPKVPEPKVEPSALHSTPAAHNPGFALMAVSMHAGTIA